METSTQTLEEGPICELAQGPPAGPSAVDCPDQTIIVVPGQTELACTLTPPDGMLWDVTYLLLGDGDFDLEWSSRS